MHVCINECIYRCTAYTQKGTYDLYGVILRRSIDYETEERRKMCFTGYSYEICISYILHCQHRAPFKIFQQDEGRCEYSQFTNEACSNFTLVAVIKYLDQKQHKEERAYLPSNSRFQSIKWGVTGEGA